jgi:hypothetical protein
VTQQEFFEEVLSTLNRLEIPHMITGSVAAMLFGNPRMTNDMDVVIELPIEKIRPLAEAFSSEAYYFPPVESVRTDVTRRGQFNIIHVESGSKVDLIIRKESQFSRTEFSRRRVVPFSQALDVPSASPEDIIISKLKYYADGGSEKHTRDIQGILNISGEKIDLKYVNLWVEKLGLQKGWKDLQDSPRTAE